MRIEIEPNASAYLQQRAQELLEDRSLPLSVRRMIAVHLAKPWISGFWSVAIRYPSGNGDPSMLDFPIGRTNGSIWYFPSRSWWLAHGNASHPPAGAGCDAMVHTDFLSKEGATHEFDYATICQDGTLKILGPRDFSEECALWKRAF